MTAETIDLPRAAVVLSRSLHRAGLAVTPDRSTRFVRALELISAPTGSDLYWAARLAFVSRREDIAAFDAVFRAILDSDISAPQTGARSAESQQSKAPREASSPQTDPARRAKGTGPLLVFQARLRESQAETDEDRPEGVLAAASEVERLGDKHFAELDSEELETIAELVRRLRVATPLRRSRRARRGSRGDRLDLRTTLRRSLRTGGDPVSQAFKARRLRRRRLVMICDVSGSMEPYARAFLQLMQGAVGGASAEAFVFATRLTRLTRALRGPNPEGTIQRAAKAAPDWSGGTRIGEALRAFNANYGRRGMARGAIVVILSDGWEVGGPATLEAEMQSLGRLAHRIIWVNPRSAAKAFEPLAGGMAAALPYCDELVSGHSLAALRQVAAAIAADGSSGARAS